MADAIVIGAGISGAATAYELAVAGLDVVLLDRYGPAAMASGWSLAGVRQSGRDPAELPLARASVDLWLTLAERLEAPTRYRRGGNLRLARSDAEVGIIESLVREQTAAGLGITMLRGSAEINAVAQAVSPHVLAASYCPTDGDADPVATVNAYVDAARRAGATTRFGEIALEIGVEAGSVTGVRTDAGFIPAGRVILAAGIFGNDLLEPLGLHVPLDIQVVTVLQTVPVERVLEQVIGVANGDCAGRQEYDGRFRFTTGLRPFAGTIEDGARPRVRPTIADVGDTVSLFADLVPAVRTAPLDAIWGGLIDLTPDALPVLQAMAEPRGLIVGMGFSGHGFCLGPITGKILAALAQDQDPGLPIEPFRIERFARRNAIAEKLTLHG